MTAITYNEILEYGPIFGTYRLFDETCKISIHRALECGFRAFDTSWAYNNHNIVVESCISACASLGIERSSIIIISKIGPKSMGYEKTKLVLEEALPVDIWLIHWPYAAGKNVNYSQIREATWQALEEHYSASHECRGIGVSNYTEDLLHEMKSYASILPLFNQIECHPLIATKDIPISCPVMAYSIFGSKSAPLLRDENLSEISRYLGISIIELLMIFHLNKNRSFLLSSSDPVHIADLHNIYVRLQEKVITLPSFSHIPKKHFCWFAGERE